MNGPVPPRHKSRRDRPVRQPQGPASAPRGHKGLSAPLPSWLVLGVLVLAALAAYQPAVNGGLLWDDAAHVTREALRSTAGLWRIWFDVGATQQYYPVAHTAFWILARAFGDGLLAYHIVNILLHAVSAWLLVLILRRLDVPGAVLAGVIFALHPVHVESVAWITELKNTLSGVFYFAAALTYLAYEQRRRAGLYVAALALFALALLSKTVTATLPAALLVVIWWRHGRLSWRRDILPLLPLVFMGALLGAVTVWFEGSIIGARGGDFSFTPIERCLIAGRATWFYLSKLVWPADLMFIYPRWQVSQSAWWQYLFPVSAVTLTALLWRARNWSRAPLAALLYFVITLAPALGFVNVYPFIFSFVADHFQYLASVGIIALASGAIATFASRQSGVARHTTAVVGVTLGIVLGGLTWQQSAQYVSAETLYRSTIDRNPGCWLAYANLGELLLRGSPDSVQRSVELSRKALQLRPEYAEAHYNLGLALEKLGRVDEAASEYRLALGYNPGGRAAEAHQGLGRALQKSGKLEEAIAQHREALKSGQPTADMHNDLGIALAESGRPNDALLEFQSALQLDGGHVLARMNTANALLQLGRPQDAMTVYESLMQVLPESADLHYNAGAALTMLGRLDEAENQFVEVLRLDPRIDAARAQLERVRQLRARR